MIGKIVDKGTIKSLDFFVKKMFQSRFLTGMMGEISQAVLFYKNG